MLSLSFIKEEGTLETIDVTESQFEYLYNIGVSTKLIYRNYKMKIDDEEVKLFSAKLGTDRSKNRKVAKELFDNEILKQVDAITNKLQNNPTVKEIREQMETLDLLNKLYKCFNNSENIYFSYE